MSKVQRTFDVVTPGNCDICEKQFLFNWSVNYNQHTCPTCRKEHARRMLPLYWNLKPLEQAGVLQEVFIG
jgi:hypothetical protein